MPNRRRRELCALAMAGGLGLAAPAGAQSVALNGMLGERKALLLIDGQPRTLGVGESHQGVKLLALSDGQAQVQIGSQRSTLRVGQAPARIGDSGRTGAGNGQQIVLTAGPGGHFTTLGSINGKSISFMVDTGATSVAFSRADAERMGIDLSRAPTSVSSTANGLVQVHVVMLDLVRIGDVEVRQVQGVVLPAAMPHALLGNSFLTRFQMKRENDRLTLDKRP